MKYEEEKPLYTMDNDYLSEQFELFSKGIEHQLKETKLFEQKINCDCKILMTGSHGGWRGRTDYESTLLDSIESFCEKVYFEYVEIKVYKDSVDILNTHHDGCNRYTLKPFEWDDLTVNELRNVIINDDLWDYSKDYWEDIKRRDLRKHHYVEFLQNVFDSETINTGQPE